MADQIKVLAIGDPHIKQDNAPETGLMGLRLVELIAKERPDIVVCLGDILHTFDRIQVDPLRRAVEFLKALRDTAPHLYVLIGNHDRSTNADFLSDIHPFTALTGWERTTVVDKALVRTHTTRSGTAMRFAFVPYVPPGRFAEALATADLKVTEDGTGLRDITAIYAHQEIKGVRMGGTFSVDGDAWPLACPLLISGHIHDYCELQPNAIFTGTPIAHSHTDAQDKTVSIFTFEAAKMVRHERVSLNLPKKLQVRLTPDEFLHYVPPKDAHVRIVIEGDPKVIRPMFKIERIKALLATHGIKVTIRDMTREAVMVPVEERKTMAYTDRLRRAIEQEPADVQTAFTRLFGTFGPVPKVSEPTPTGPRKLKIV